MYKNAYYYNISRPHRCVTRHIFGKRWDKTKLSNIWLINENTCCRVYIIHMCTYHILYNNSTSFSLDPQSMSPIDHNSISIFLTDSSIRRGIECQTARGNASHDLSNDIIIKHIIIKCVTAYIIIILKYTVEILKLFIITKRDIMFHPRSTAIIFYYFFLERSPTKPLSKI